MEQERSRSPVPAKGGICLPRGEISTALMIYQTDCFEGHIELKDSLKMKSHTLTSTIQLCIPLAIYLNINPMLDTKDGLVGVSGYLSFSSQHGHIKKKNLLSLLFTMTCLFNWLVGERWVSLVYWGLQGSSFRTKNLRNNFVELARKKDTFWVPSHSQPVDSKWKIKQSRSIGGLTLFQGISYHSTLTGMAIYYQGILYP